MGDLIFSLSFDCLYNFEYPPWVEKMIEMVKGVTVLFGMHYVGLRFLVNARFYTVGNERFNNFNQTIRDMLKHRLDVDVPQEDIFQGLVRRSDELVSPLITFLLFKYLCVRLTTHIDKPARLHMVYTGPFNR